MLFYANVVINKANSTKMVVKCKLYPSIYISGLIKLQNTLKLLFF